MNTDWFSRVLRVIFTLDKPLPAKVNQIACHVTVAALHAASQPTNQLVWPYCLRAHRPTHHGSKSLDLHARISFRKMSLFS